VYIICLFCAPAPPSLARSLRAVCGVRAGGVPSHASGAAHSLHSRRVALTARARARAVSTAAQGELQDTLAATADALTAERGRRAALGQTVEELRGRVAQLRLELGQAKQQRQGQQARQQLRQQGQGQQAGPRDGGGGAPAPSGSQRPRRQRRWSVDASASPAAGRGGSPPRSMNSTPRRRLGSQNSPPQVDGDYRQGGVAWGRSGGGSIGSSPARGAPTSWERPGGSFTRQGGGGGGAASLPPDSEAGRGAPGAGARRSGRRPRRSRSASPPRRAAGGAATDGPGAARLPPPPSRATLQRLLAERDRLRAALASAREAHRAEVAELQAALVQAEEQEAIWRQRGA
jgi:hypothetical protein